MTIESVDRQWVDEKTDPRAPGVVGWFDYYQLYMEAACLYPSGSHFVEVGTFVGASATHMAFAILTTAKDIKFDVVDTFRGEGEDHSTKLAASFPDGTFRSLFDRNVKQCRMDGLIGVHQMPSVEAAKLYADESLQFVYIDGAHRRLAVAADIEAWRPKIAPEGCLAGHDVDRAGVKWALWNTFEPEDEVKIIPELRSWRWFNAVSDREKGCEVGGDEEGREGDRHPPIEGEGQEATGSLVRG